MASKPRPSLLDLFDPLLAKAANVPIPDSPPTTPTTPQRVLERGLENKENVAPNEITMSVFFNRISRPTCSPTLKVAGPSSGQLVEFEDADDGSEGSRPQASSRLPLTELSIDEFSALAISPSIPSHKRAISPRHLKSSRTTPLPPSPLRQAELAFLLPPAISVNDISTGHDNTQATHSLIDPLLPKTIEPWRGCMQTSSNALMPPNSNNSMHNQSRRRSSVDISTNLSSFSSSSFNFQDASFDLVNGEISFLSGSLEHGDVDHDCLVDSKSLEPHTPRAIFLSETLPSEESPAASPTTMNQSGADTSYSQPSIKQTETCSKWAHSQETDISTSSSAFTRDIRGEHLPMQGSKPVSLLDMGKQSTPSNARKVSSVPAPTKKAKVFTSKHHRAADTSTKRGATGLVPTTSGSVIRPGTNASAKPPKESRAGAQISGIPRGSAGRRLVIGGTGEQCIRKSAASDRSNTAKSMTTNLKAPRTAGRPIETSVLHKGETAEQASRVDEVSRLPGPAVVRIGTVPSERLFRLPGSAHRGRINVVRSTIPK